MHTVLYSMHTKKKNVMQVEQLVIDPDVEVQNLKIRRSQYRHKHRLEQLALQLVFVDITSVSKLTQPFRNMTTEGLDLMLDFLKKEGKLYSSQILPLLVTRQTRTLELDLTYQFNKVPVHWSEQHLSRMYFWISKLCKTSLQILKLDLYKDLGAWYGPEIPRWHMHHMLIKLANLRELSLRHCNVKNDTLAIIGSTCPTLRVLDIKHNDMVTETGLRLLCHSAAPFGRCFSLTKLDLDDPPMHVMVNLLVWLPALRELPNFQKHLDCMSVIESYIAVHGELPLQLESIKVNDYKTDFEQEYCTKNYSFIQRVLPNLKCILLGIDGVDVVKFMDLPYLNKLIIDCTTPDTLNFVEHHALKLTHIEVLNCEIIDMSVIFYFCLNLEIFKFIGCDENSTHTSYNLYNRHLTKIRSFCILNDGGGLTIPENIIAAVLSSTVLEVLALDFVYVTEKVLVETIAEAHAHGRLLSNLKTLILSDCGVLPEIAIRIILHTPKLEVLSISQFDMQLLELTRFCETHNLKYILGKSEKKK